MELTLHHYRKELAEALHRYDRYVVCLDKPTEEFEQDVRRLMVKAMHAFRNRARGLRHGIALDSHMTVIISENRKSLPLCGIYFNLHSPYEKR